MRIRLPFLSASQNAFHVPLFRQIPSASLMLSIIVPVRNEAGHVLQTLHALSNQQDRQGRPFGYESYEVLLLVNNCTDETYRIARDYQLNHPDFVLHIAECWLHPEKAHIGTARRLLMDEACHRFGLLGKPKGIIASTDGDTVVDPAWVYHTIEEIQKGNDAVGGRILVDSSNGKAGSYHALDETYRILAAQTESILDPLEHDPWPRHYQYFGASLAVTASMYDRAGRLPRLPYLEDDAFHRALLRKDAKIRKSPLVKVLTSDRHQGRVCIGLSEQLKKWSQMEHLQEPQLVAGARELVAHFTNRQRVRTCWNDAHKWGRYDTDLLASAAHEFSIAPHWLQHELENSRYFGSLWENIESRMQAGGWYAKWQPVPIRTAIRELTEFIQPYCQQIV